MYCRMQYNRRNSPLGFDRSLGGLTGDKGIRGQRGSYESLIEPAISLYCIRCGIAEHDKSTSFLHVSLGRRCNLKYLDSIHFQSLLALPTFRAVLTIVSDSQTLLL